MTRSRACAVLAFVLTLTAVVYALPTIQVTPLPRDGRLLVSFRLTDAFSDEVKTAIHSGLTITFVYDIELRRSSAMWVDRTIASALITATVRYDNLTRRYYLTRMEDGRIERADTTEDEDLVRDRLTVFDKLPLFSTTVLERNTDYYVRIRAHTTPRNASFVWPWERGIAGLAKFTFIQ